tara:strand:+ start:164 stop:379 length:216 start_codon:yes stop_codon:yes gene_type:complete
VNETFRKYLAIIYTAIATLLFMSVFVWACDSFYIGKNVEELEKELVEEIWKVDSLIMEIQITLGDSSIIER